jgi:hypothetical protein
MAIPPRPLVLLLAALLWCSHAAQSEEVLAPTTPAAGTPLAVPTFHCLGLYWSPPAGAADREVKVRYRVNDAAQ